MRDTDYNKHSYQTPGTRCRRNRAGVYAFASNPGSFIHIDILLFLLLVILFLLRVEVVGKEVAGKPECVTFADSPSCECRM